ncbi:ABC transporter ATP-binding protein [Falsiroseomonas stagni]|uniref:ABC-2 type transport system ATP-binding protein n=1 Tax=Falsiroseomonas stagni DSM 19981 TaxID=1123062 RepID=A0A1I4CS92_9PROT|nr:ABC transporter ATP-binding protein [Falsiroseomonas stagni]SFK84138.1 ABC-2 type transport system ATP-binding protein [Falsiroseomonas stagni DSM 19981]
MQLPHAIEIAGLRKTYAGSKGAPGKEALKGVDLVVPRGSFFGLLGPNGAGKSTLIGILAGLVQKTGGTASVWGIDLDRDPIGLRQRIGVVPQELNLDPFFTPREAMEMQAGLYGVPRARRRTMEILDAVGLADKADAYARSLSGGMRRRLLVAKAMVHAPPVLVLDEPTAGVDIELREQLWRMVQGLNRAGTTIVLTTHYLEEAESLCDRIAIIGQGRLIANEPTRELIARLDDKTITVTVAADLGAVPPGLEGFEARLDGPRRLEIRYRARETRVEDILDAVRGAGLAIQDLSTKEADLNATFLRLTREQAPA